MSTFVDEQNLNSNRQQGIIGEGESDSEVLHGEDTVQAGRTGGVEEESTEVNGGVVGEDGVVSAGAGEVDRQGNSINEQSDLVIEHI